MSKIDVLLGLQWGDEGKGKIVDVLTKKYDVVCRFQGGPNAGHTVVCNGQSYILRLIPSGILQGSMNVIGNGVVVDPILLWDEIKELEGKGICWSDLTKNLVISEKAHLILPIHRILDAANEKAKGEEKFGTTGRGIGPTYTDKVSRIGFRMGDIHATDFRKKYLQCVQRHSQIIREVLHYPIAENMYEEQENQWFSALECLKDNFRIVNTEYLINEQLQAGKKILAEGAQGTLLDIDFGSYPFVTSSNTTVGAVCTGLGVSPRYVGEIYGIFKAYCTRVGSGPFPTELNNEVGEKIGRRGKEFGAVTGRKRRCGWIDLVALRYAIMINGVTQLIMMKSDVLDTFETIQACVAYNVNGRRTETFPFDLKAGEVEPIYETLSGWKTDLTKITSKAELPVEFWDYIFFLEKMLKVPITTISVGPDRGQTILR
ncbi:MAG: adenylosuccinate synthase [Candidatus Peribacteria bacterium]|jgi:adenylosuccinate synthase|nr:adenylosuccinate synthase [Candidatus Peribacteria bacterium]